MVTVNFSNKTFYFLVGFAFLLVGSLAVTAYTNSIPNPGHGGDTTWIDVPGQGEMTLQQAITNGVLGGGSGGLWIPTNIVASPTHNGNFGGYKELDQWIKQNVGSNYHACSAEEVVRYVSKNGNFPTTGRVIGFLGDAWKSGYLTSDCDGWTYGSGGADREGRHLLWSSVDNKINTFDGDAQFYTTLYCSVEFPFLACSDSGNVGSGGSGSSPNCIYAESEDLQDSKSYTIELNDLCTSDVGLGCEIILWSIYDSDHSTKPGELDHITESQIFLQQSNNEWISDRSHVSEGRGINGDGVKDVISRWFNDRACRLWDDDLSVGENNPKNIILEDKFTAGSCRVSICPRG